MNGFINPPCKILLATFFELNFEVCEKKASSCFRRLVCLKRTIIQFFELLFPLSHFDVPEKKVAGERGEESPAGGPDGPKEVGGVWETKAGAEADVEDQDEDVDVVGVSGYESEGFMLSEILRRKRLAKKNVSEGVVDTAHLPQCEFSNRHHLPITFLLEFLCWPVMEFY